MTTHVGDDSGVAADDAGNGSSGKALLAFGLLSRRLKADWVLLRNCRIAAGTEHYAVQLVMIHPYFGIALIAFRDEAYTFPDLAVRLTRDFLLQEGFRRKFKALPPIVFITAGEGEAREVPGYIARAFAAEAANTIADPEWANWTARALGRTAAEYSRGRAEEPAPDAPQDSEVRPNERVMTRKHALSAVSIAAALLLLVGMGAGAFVGLGKFVADRSPPPVAVAVAAAPVSVPPRLADCSARLIDEDAAAHYLGLDLDSFHKLREELERKGFPHPESVTNRYDRIAIDRWLDGGTRSGNFDAKRPRTAASSRKNNNHSPAKPL